MDLTFQPKQREFLRMLLQTGADVPTVLMQYGARGGSKSKLIRMAMLLRRMSLPGTVGFIMRRRFKDLEENQIQKFRLEYPELDKFWKGGEEYKFDNGSRICFKYGDTYIDIESMSRGPECYDLAVDQAEQFTEAELTLLSGCTRWPGATAGGPKKWLMFNTGGQGKE